MIEEIGSFKNQIFWKCQCNCGEIKNISTNSLMSMNTQSCGCLRIERVSKKLTKNLENLRFGKLLVLEKSQLKNINCRNTKWKCLCDCGKIKCILSYSLTSGRTKSCGCRSRGNQTHGTIYGIYDKDDNLVYVGQTIKYNIEDRLTSHLQYPYGKMKIWLSTINYRPTIKAIIENVKIEDLYELEIEIIKQYNSKFNLLNTQYST